MSSRIEASLNRPFSFNIDIVDACNLRCVHCPRGVYHKKNTQARMGLDFFKRLLEKMTSESDCRKIDLYNWSEPFLHPDLDKFVAAVKDKGIACGLSSNLSFINEARLEAVLLHAPSLIVSVSGFTQEVHERYHKGSNLENVKSNLTFISGLREKHDLSLNVRVHCLQFKDNQEDQQLWEKYCGDYGLTYCGTPAYCSEVTTPETAARLIYQPAFYQDANGETKVRMYYSEGENIDPCPLHNTVPINAQGDVYLCCIYWNRAPYRIANYLDVPMVSLQERRLQHRDCSHCTVFRKT